MPRGRTPITLEKAALIPPRRQNRQNKPGIICPATGAIADCGLRIADCSLSVSKAIKTDAGRETRTLAK
jgi:hypothetical protein